MEVDFEPSQSSFFSTRLCSKGQYIFDTANTFSEAKVWLGGAIMYNMYEVPGSGPSIRSVFFLNWFLKKKKKKQVLKLTPF